MLVGTITLGALGAYVILGIAIFALALVLLYSIAEQEARVGIGALACFAVFFLLWFWGMAFTFSSDYHSWNPKSSKVVAVSKRIVPAGDTGIQERFVFKLEDGALYGVDDTRASLVRVGDFVNLKCKKDFEWGTPRYAHGWACKWNGRPPGE